MKAAVFKALHQPLVVESLPDPTPGPLDVIVKVGRCGICGSDLHITEDAVFGVPPGVVLGHEYAGEVVEVGRDVQHLKVGDRLAAFPLESCGECGPCRTGFRAWCERGMVVGGGGYGEYSKVAQHQVVRMPAGVSLEDGALVEPLAVALHGVNLSGLRSGARVLVVGAGPIGLATVFWARRMGAGRIACTASSTRRAELAMQMGASAFVAPSDDPVGEVNRALGGPPEVVFECVGMPGLIERCVEHCAPRGTVVVVGLCTQPDHFQPFTLVSKEVRIQPSAFYEVRDFETTLDVLDAGVTTPEAMITDHVSLTALPDAFEALKHRTHQCKVMVNPWG
jgi:(R,R)-butanediol dehydrogenase/meso-butanediol dehydrogenase/diacetyl reductase